MTSIDYTKIFESFLGNITDNNFANLSLSDSYQIMTEYLHKVVSNPYIRRIFSSISLDDEIQVLSYEMKYEDDDDIDEEFVVHVLGKAMVYEWVHNQVRSVNLTAQMFSGKEQNAYSQANHLNALRALEEDTLKELRLLISDRHIYFNTYLEN